MIFFVLALAIPKIDVIYPPYGTIFDRGCGTKEIIRQAGELRPALQAEWDVEGPKYLAIAFHEIGLPFPYREMQAYLTVCDVSTMSMPLMINVRRLLPSSSEHPPRGDFSEKVFHELMHHYVSVVRDSALHVSVVRDSALRKKYAGEHAVVVNHLHVMALEKLILTRLGKEDELKYIDQLYQTDPAPSHYKRAWEIVNDIEGYEVFIRELKAAAR